MARATLAEIDGYLWTRPSCMNGIFTPNDLVRAVR